MKKAVIHVITTYRKDECSVWQEFWAEYTRRIIAAGKGGNAHDVEEGMWVWERVLMGDV